MIVGILATLVWLYVRLDRTGLRGAERWALGVPASLFLGWVAVATALNVSVALRATGWEADGVLWPAAVVALVAVVGAWLLWRTGDAALALVLLWAYAAIAARADQAALLAVLLTSAAALVGSAVVGVRRHSPFPTAHAEGAASG